MSINPHDAAPMSGGENVSSVRFAMGAIPHGISKQTFFASSPASRVVPRIATLSSRREYRRRATMSSACRGSQRLRMSPATRKSRCSTNPRSSHKVALLGRSTSTAPVQYNFPRSLDTERLHHPIREVLGEFGIGQFMPAIEQTRELVADDVETLARLLVTGKFAGCERTPVRSHWCDSLVMTTP